VLMAHHQKFRASETPAFRYWEEPRAFLG
jgi:hypothetical protein